MNKQHTYQRGVAFPRIQALSLERPSYNPSSDDPLYEGPSQYPQGYVFRKSNLGSGGKYARKPSRKLSRKPSRKSSRKVKKSSRKYRKVSRK